MSRGAPFMCCTILFIQNNKSQNLHLWLIFFSFFQGTDNTLGLTLKLPTLLEWQSWISKRQGSRFVLFGLHPWAQSVYFQWIASVPFLNSFCLSFQLQTSDQSTLNDKGRWLACASIEDSVTVQLCSWNSFTRCGLLWCYDQIRSPPLLWWWTWCCDVV